MLHKSSIWFFHYVSMNSALLFLFWFICVSIYLILSTEPSIFYYRTFIENFSNFSIKSFIKKNQGLVLLWWELGKKIDSHKEGYYSSGVIWNWLYLGSAGNSFSMLGTWKFLLLEFKEISLYSIFSYLLRQHSAKQPPPSYYITLTNKCIIFKH